jgi:glycosyltransferase involved in cell wall biosynthesis
MLVSTFQPNPSLSRDVYLAVFSDADGWGGGLSIALGVETEIRQRGATTLLLGIAGDADAAPRVDPNTRRVNFGLTPPRATWRFQSWLTIGALERRLSRLPPPKRAFVGLSMFWVVAAKRVWPDVPSIYLFPCLLSNCLPFTWPGRKPPSLWARIDLAGVRRAEHLAFDTADRIVTATRQGADEIARFHPAARDRIRTSYFGCRPAATDAGQRDDLRRLLQLSADDFLIAAIGVCDRNKAFDLAIRELPNVDPRGRLAIVGDGPQRESWRRFAEELGVADRVYFAGSQRDMGPWYAAAAAVISTSCYDTFPNVILEALQAGTPVLVPEHDPPHVYAGAAELLREAGGGLLYDRQTPGGLADALNRLIRNPTLRGELNAAGREAARRLLRWEGCADYILGNREQVAAARRTAAVALH